MCSITLLRIKDVNSPYISANIAKIIRIYIINADLVCHLGKL